MWLLGPLYTGAKKERTLYEEYLQTPEILEPHATAYRGCTLHYWTASDPDRLLDSLARHTG